MAFDINTAKPIKKGGFDINTAKPVNQVQFGGGQPGAQIPAQEPPPAPFGSYDDPRAVMNRLAGTTPEQLAQTGHPIAASVQMAGQDMITIPAHFLNQLLLNAPRSLQETFTNTKFPETDNPIANPLAKAAGVAGGLLSGGKILSAPKTLLGKMGAGAAAGALYSPTEDFTDVKKRAEQAVIGGTFPATTAALSKVGSIARKGISEITPAKIINSVIKPLKKDFVYGKNPGRAIAEEGIVGNDLDDLYLKIKNRMDELGNELGSQYKESNKTINTKGLLDSLMLSKDKAMAAPKTNSALISRIDDAISDVSGIVANKKKMSVYDAHKAKQIIGDITKWTGSQSDDSCINKALQGVYRKLKTRIETEIPGVKKQNERFADFISAKNAIEHRIAYSQRNNINSLTSNLAGLGTSAISVSGGLSAIPAITLGFVSQQIVRALGTPAAKTRIARLLSKASKVKLLNLSKEAPEFVSAVNKLVENGKIKLPSRVIDSLNAQDEGAEGYE